MSTYSELNFKEAQQLWDAFEVFLRGFRQKDPGDLLVFGKILIQKQQELTRLIELGASELVPIGQVWTAIRLDLKFSLETQGQIEEILDAAALRFPALFVIKETQRNQTPWDIAIIMASLTCFNETSVFLV